MREQGRRKGTVNPNGAEVERLRLLKGWGQERLEAESRVSRRTIQRVEAGEPALPETLMLLAESLGVSYDSLINMKPEQRSMTSNPIGESSPTIIEAKNEGITIRFERLEIHIDGSSTESEKAKHILSIVSQLMKILPNGNYIKIVFTNTVAGVVILDMLPSTANALAIKSDYSKFVRDGEGSITKVRRAKEAESVREILGHEEPAHSFKLEYLLPMLHELVASIRMERLEYDTFLRTECRRVAPGKTIEQVVPAEYVQELKSYNSIQAIANNNLEHALRSKDVNQILAMFVKCAAAFRKHHMLKESLICNGHEPIMDRHILLVEEITALTWMR